MPDDLDDWVFDDDFVRAGRHEPPARTRAAIARFGGRRTSWRQPGDPVGAPPPDRARRRRDSVAGTGLSPGRSRLNRWLAIGLVMLVSGAVVTTWLHHDHRASAIPARAQQLLGRGPTISARPASITPATEPDDTHEVHGITPATPVGTCFRTAAGSASPTPTGPIDLTATACGNPHTFELVAIEQASGSASFPDTSYWGGPVADACRAAFATYTGGRGISVTPDGRASSFFRPLRSGWAQGDRTVYCVASSATPVAGTVRAGGA